MSATSPPLLHWNYFLALESDFEKLSRYVEITEDNYETFSLEMAHLLLASSSEVDVVLKGICKRLKPERRPKKIDKYREIITQNIPQFSTRNVLIPRYNLQVTPWEKWSENDNPNWWKAYNKVKHDRGNKYKEANLKHTVASMAGLFIATLHLYDDIAKEGLLGPNPRLLYPDNSYSEGLTPTNFGMTTIYNL